MSQRDLAEKAEITPNEMEALYSRAMGLLQAGLYRRAVYALGSLIVLRPSEPRFYRSLGLAYQHQRQYGMAYGMYGVAMELDPQDGVSQALRAECGVFVEPREAALASLSAVVNRGVRHPREKPYIDRAQWTLTRLERIAQRSSP